LWPYLLRQLVSLILGHSHQLLMECVNPPLCGGFFWSDYCFVIEGLLIKVNEVRGGPLSPGGAVSGIVPNLAAFKAGVIAGAGRRLGNAVPGCPPLLSPAGRSSGAA